MGLTEDQQNQIWLVTCITSVISILSSSFIIAVYARFKELRGFSFKLIFYLSLTDVLFSIGFLFRPDNGREVCSFQGMYLTWFGLSSILWTLNIALALYLSVVKQVQDVEKYEFKMVVLGYFIPGVVSLLPWSTNSYGEAGGLCWIQGNNTGLVLVWRLITFYAPLWIIIATNIIIYVKIINEIYKYVSDEVEDQLSADRLVRRLKLYPLLLIVDYSFATVNRLYEFIYPDDPLFVLIIIAWSFASISGFFNAIVYGLTPSVRIALRNFCSGDLMAQGDEELILND